MINAPTIHALLAAITLAVASSSSSAQDGKPPPVEATPIAATKVVEVAVSGMT